MSCLLFIHLNKFAQGTCSVQAQYNTSGDCWKINALLNVSLMATVVTGERFVHLLSSSRFCNLSCYFDLKEHSNFPTILYILLQWWILILNIKLKNNTVILLYKEPALTTSSGLRLQIIVLFTQISVRMYIFNIATGSY